MDGLLLIPFFLMKGMQFSDKIIKKLLKIDANMNVCG